MCIACVVHCLVFHLCCHFSGLILNNYIENQTSCLKASKLTRVLIFVKFFLKTKKEEYFVDTVLEKAKRENEKENERKENLIKKLFNKEALKNAVKSELANIEKDPFAKADKIENETEPEPSSQLETGVQTYPSGIEISF